MKTERRLLARCVRTLDVWRNGIVTQSLRDIIQRRQKALVSAWILDPLLQVQAESPSALAGLVFLDDYGAAAHTGTVGRRKSTSAAIVRRNGNPDENCSLWVAAPYSGYRQAYLTFIKEAYNVAVTSNDLAGYDIDHLLNRARAPQDSTFVRVEAVTAAANQEWGRLFEKKSSNPDFFANQKRERRTMSWMICAKLSGQMPPHGPADNAGINRLVTYFVMQGLSAQEAREGLTSMLKFAYRQN